MITHTFKSHVLLTDLARITHALEMLRYFAGHHNIIETWTAVFNRNSSARDLIASNPLHSQNTWFPSIYRFEELDTNWLGHSMLILFTSISAAGIIHPERRCFPVLTAVTVHALNVYEMYREKYSYPEHLAKNDSDAHLSGRGWDHVKEAGSGLKRDLV